MPSLRKLRRRMLGYLHQIFRGASDQPAVRQAYPRLYDSQLETRRVLNADAPAVAGDLLAIVLNAGTQADDGRADRFEISQIHHQGRQEISVSINDQQVWQGSADQLQSLRIEGSGDSDQFVIDPTIQFAGLISIDGGVNHADSAPDVLIVQADARPLHTVTIQDQPGHIQLQFALYEAGSSRESDSAHTSAGRLADSIGLWQVTNVGQIVDYSQASERNLQLTHSPSWSFSSHLDSRGNSLLQLTSDETRYQFVAPTDSLVISTESSATNIQEFLLHDLDISSIDYVRLQGDRFDSIVQQGWLTASQQLVMTTGSVELTGTIQSHTESHMTVQASRILQSGLMRLGPGSSVLLDSGAGGQTTINGQMIVLGDQQHLGGSVTITGDTVQLGASALIDVSGIKGGGQVLIGGDRAGANPLVRNAFNTTLAAGARISADATAIGNGGRIIVYSTDRTVIENASNLSARGGVIVGDGGFIETSGRRHLTMHGSPTVSAAAGRAGQWLIDPEAISIVAVLPGVPDPNISYLLVADLLTLINAGGDVILQTTTANPGLGDIVIEAPVVAAPGVSARLILQAARDIVFNATFVGNANLGLELQATRDVDASAVTLSSMNYVTIQAGDDALLRNVSVGSGSANGGTALDIDVASVIALTGNLTSNGGNITLSGPQLQIDGSATRTITSGGSGLTASTGGNIDLSGLTAIDGTGSAADLTIDASGILNGGTVRLSTVIDAIAGIRNLTVDTRGATTTGQLILDNGLASSTSIVVSGNLSFTNANTQLADSVVLTTTGDTSTLTLGNVSTDGTARALTLSSEASLSFGSMNLTGGALIAQVDVDNDGIAALTGTGTVTAGSMQFIGSNAKNDSLSLSGNLTSTVGNIILNSFNLAQLSGDSVSQVGFTAININTLSLNSNVDITTTGVLDLDSSVTGILLSGTSGSRNILDASGTVAAVNLTAVTSTNSNVDLTIRSDRNVNLKSMLLVGSQIDVQFSRNNAANDSTVSFTSVVGSDGLSVTGASRTNDSVGFGAPVVLGAAGLSVTQVANTLFLASVTTSTGDIVVSSTADTALSGDFITAGGDITLSGARLTIDGTAPRTILSGGDGVSANTAGNINLSGLNEIDGLVAPADLTIDARGILNGGTVRLASVTNTLAGIRNLTVDTRGATTNGQLILNNGLAANTSINVSGNLNFSQANTQLADNVNLTTRGNTSTLTLGNVSTDGAARTLQLTSDANISTGSVNLTGGTLSAQIDANNDGVASFTNTAAIAAGALQISGSAANNDSVIAQSNLTSTVGGIALNNLIRVQLSGDSVSQTDFTATNVTTVELNSGADISASGAINLDSTVSGILLSGTSGTQNIIDASGADAAVNLSAVTSTNSNVDLSVRSDRSANLKSITLTGAQVDVLFSRNNAANNSVATFSAAVSSDGLSVTGASRTNDTVNVNAPLTLATAGLNISQVANTQINSAVTTTTGDISIASTATTLAVNLTTNGGSILINGGTTLTNNVALTTQGNSGQITIGSVSASGGARNLQLTSDSNITTGSVNLSGGAFTAQVDANNDGVASFTSTGAISGSTLQISGSAAKNDSLFAQGNLTSTIGGITLSNFNRVQLSGDSVSQVDFTAANINSLELNTGADIFAEGALNLDSTVSGILLIGTSGSQNILDATGTNADVRLAAVTSTNNNVDLAIRSDRSLFVKSITLNGSQVDVQFSRNNPANNSVASFTAAVTSDGLTVTGASRTNDGVTFSAPVNLGAAGLSVANVASTQVITSITSTTGAIAIASSNSTMLAGNLTTAGGTITLSGALLQIDGSTLRTISSGGNGLTANTAGNINLSGLAAIDGLGVPADLTIDARGIVNGGNVRLASVTNTFTGIRNLTVDTRGATTTGQLILDNGLAASTSIDVSGNLNFSNANTQLADNVLLTTRENTSSLTLGNISTDGFARNLQLKSDANISTGSMNLTGGSLSAQVDANNDGIAAFTSTDSIAAGSLQINGSAAKNDTLSAQGNLTSTIGGIELNNFDRVQLSGDSTSQVDFTATNITTFQLNSNADVTAIGAINLDSTVTGIVLGGTSGSRNVLDASGTNAVINLAPITSTNNIVDLAIRSDRSVNLKSVNLSGAQVDVEFSRNNPANNSSADFTAAVNSDGLSVTGAARTNDNVTFNAPLTLGAAGLNVSQVGTVLVNADINANGDIFINQVSNRIQLIQNGRVVGTGNIDLRTGVTLLQLSGAGGTLNEIVSSTDSGTVSLANTTSAGANLNVLSNNNVALGDVDLGTLGRLQVEIDRNNNAAFTQLTSGSLHGASLAILGSAAQNDTAVLSGTLKSESGSISVSQFSFVTLTGDVTSATELTVSNVAIQLRLGTNVDLAASNGNLNMALGTGAIILVGSPGSAHTLDARGAMNLSTISSINSVQATLLADSDVQLGGSNIQGALDVTAGNHGALSGRIETTGRLNATSLTLNSATGIGSTNELLTGAGSLSATNRLAGDIRIDNEHSSTDVNQLRTLSGGNIAFRQTSGPARFHRVESLADATPDVNENRIDLSVATADLNISSSGLTTNGIGPVNVKTLFLGSINLQADTQAAGSSVLLQAATHILGTGKVTGQSVRFEASGDIGGANALRTQTTQLSSQTVSGKTSITNTSAASLQVSDMRSLVGGGILLRQTGGGDAILGSITTAGPSDAGAPDIVLINEAGSLVVNGVVGAGTQGSINLQAQNDIVLSSTSRLTTVSETALIEGNAVGQIQFQPGAVVRAGTGSPATEAVMTQITPLIQVLSVINSLGVNVDNDGLGVIDILLLPSGIGIIDQNYELVIDWGGGAIDRLPLGPLDVNTLPTGVSRFDASLAAYRITHQYLQNPNGTDPSADIPVRVTAQVDPLNRIRFADSQGIDQQLSASANSILVVPSTGLISLYFVLPQTPTIQKQLAFARDNSDAPTIRAVAGDRSEPPTVTSTTSSVQQQRKIILRVMTPVDESGRVEASKDPKDDIPLSPEDLADLNALFARLSDNRYRIYIIMEDGNEVLLKDILLRNHQPAEVEDMPNLKELDRTQIPSLDDAQPIAPPKSPNSQPGATTSAIPLDENRDHQPLVEEPTGVLRSWRKAARRFRAS